MKKLIKITPVFLSLTLLSGVALANMTVSFKNNALVKGTKLYGIAAGIQGMGAWATLNGKTFTVNQAPGKNLPINTVINALFNKPGYIPASGNAVIGWDAASQQFNYGWGDNTPYGTGKLCMNITVDGKGLPEICTSSSTKGIMTSAHVAYSSSSKVVVTFSGQLIK